MQSPMNVEAEYRQLVSERKVCAACVGLRNPSSVDGGIFDSAEIGPWTNWQGKLDATLMVVGQDYSDVEYFRRQRGTEDPRNPTNINLIELLKSVGVDVGPPRRGVGRDEAFFTNAILCLKTGGMQGKVDPAWFRECGQRFLRRQIDLVRPRVVVGLGERAHNAVLTAFGLPPQSIRSAVVDPGIKLSATTTAIGVYHCGARVVNISRPLKQQIEDWKRIAAALPRTPHNPR